MDEDACELGAWSVALAGAQICLLGVPNRSQGLWSEMAPLLYLNKDGRGGWGDVKRDGGETND